MKRILSFCLLCVYVLAGNAQPRFGTMPQGAPPVPAPRPAFVPPPVAAPSFGSNSWSSPPPVAAPVQNWSPPQTMAPQVAAPVFGGPTPWNAPIAVPQPFGQGQSFSPAPVVAAPVFVPPVVQPQVQRPAIDAPIPQAIYSPSIAPNLAQPLPSDRVTPPRLETPTSPQSIAPILSGPVVPRAPPQTGYTITAKGGNPSTSLNTVFPQDPLSGRTPASSRFLSAPSDTTANPQSTSALAQGFLKEVPVQTKNAVIGTGEGVWEGLVNTAKVVGQVPGLLKDLQVAGYSPSTYRQAYAEVKAVSTDPSVRQYYANTVTTATQNLVSGTTAAAQRWFQSTDAREPSRAIASATTQAVIAEVAVARAGTVVKAAFEQPPKRAVLENARWAQLNYSKNFSVEGIRIIKNRTGLLIQNIDEMVSALREKRISPTQVPIEYIKYDGNSVILNTRSAVALDKAGIPREAWHVVDVSTDVEAVNRFKEQIMRNSLSTSGTTSYPIQNK